MLFMVIVLSWVMLLVGVGVVVCVVVMRGVSMRVMVVSRCRGMRCFWVMVGVVWIVL